MALITVMVISLVLTLLLVLVATHEDHADVQSARGRNFDEALGVAEAGIQQGMAKIQAAGGIPAQTSFNGNLPQGIYRVSMTRSPGQWVLEASGTAGATRLGRKRVVKVTMLPPRSFRYVLYSDTYLSMNNNDIATGDIWANNNVDDSSNTVVNGSITAAAGYVNLQGGVTVQKDVWSGGTNPNGPYAVQLGNGAKVHGSVKASVSSDCSGVPASQYAVPLGSGAEVDSNLTTWGSKSGPGTLVGTYSPNTCTMAAVPQPLPSFSKEWISFDRTFSSLSSFQTWLNGNMGNLRGAYYVSDPSPSQNNRIDLNNAKVTGDLTIVTNAPIFTNNATDSADSKVAIFVSSYAPPAGSTCDVNQDRSECAIHLKNNFQPSCYTAVLVYANNGPAAVKNNYTSCGAIYADTIFVKNNQTLTWDPRIERILGFGPMTFEVGRWEELAPSAF